MCGIILIFVDDRHFTEEAPGDHLTILVPSTTILKDLVVSTSVVDEKNNNIVLERAVGILKGPPLDDFKFSSQVDRW